MRGGKREGDGEGRWQNKRKIEYAVTLKSQSVNSVLNLDFSLRSGLSTTDTDNIFYITKKLQHQRKHTF